MRVGDKKVFFSATTQPQKRISWTWAMRSAKISSLNRFPKTGLFKYVNDNQSEFFRFVQNDWNLEINCYKVKTDYLLVYSQRIFNTQSDHFLPYWMCMWLIMSAILKCIPRGQPVSHWCRKLVPWRLRWTSISIKVSVNCTKMHTSKGTNHTFRYTQTYKEELN